MLTFFGAKRCAECGRPIKQESFSYMQGRHHHLSCALKARLIKAQEKREGS